MASALQVILTEDSQAGKAGELIKVRPGFARNFLLRRGLAVVADKNTLKSYEEGKAEIEKQAEEKKGKAENIKETIGEAASIIIQARAGESGKLFGAITKEKIFEACNKQFNVNLTKENIKLKTPIKALGEYTIQLDLGSNIQTEVTIKVVTEN